MAGEMPYFVLAVYSSVYANHHTPDVYVCEKVLI
jgi:hypothetical protein